MEASKPDGRTPVRTKPWAFGPISTEEIGDLEKEYVLRVLSKKRLFRYGGSQEHSEAYALEQLYKERTKVKHCLGVNAGTSALISALIGAGIGPGDEVIIPAYTYVATATAVLIARAVPVIVEVDDSLTMDPQAFEAAITPHTKAVIPVHMRGVPCQMDEIMSIARKANLIVIEDVAQANGGSYKGRALGSIGDAGCLSFQQYKLVTAGEGGMLLTSGDAIYARASIYHDSAFTFWGKDRFARWGTNSEVDFAPFPGENYRMSELNAALAMAQSQRIDSLVNRLQRLKSKIVEGIRDIPGIQLQKIPDPQGDVSYSLVFYLPTIAKAQQFSRDLRAEGIPNGTIDNNGFADRHIFKNWSYVMEKQAISDKDNPWTNEHYKGTVEYSPDMCPRTLEWLSRAISIALHQTMTDEDASDLIQAVRKAAAAI